MELSKKVTAVLVMALVVVCMGGYLLLFPKVFEKLGLAPDGGADIAVQESSEEAREGTGEENSRTISLLEKLIEVKNKAETKFNDVFLKIQFVEFNGLLSKMMHKNFIIDANEAYNVYKLKNGYISEISTSKSPSTVDNARKTINLKNYTKEKGIDFLYVLAPDKINKFENLLPEGVEDFANKNADEFLSAIEVGGVNSLDLRQVMYEEGINHYDMFFRTDHHWIPEAGLWAASKINQHLAQNYGFVDKGNLLNPANFNSEVYKDMFLGTIGRRTGKLYTELDDISLIYPKYETAMEFSIPSADIYLEGGFKDVVFKYSRLEDNLYEVYPYAAYTGGDYPLNVIKNSDGDGKKVLLLKDSYALVTAPFLALGFSELHMFDIRYNEMPVREYIEENDFDLVLVLHSAAQVSNNNNFVNY